MVNLYLVMAKMTVKEKNEIKRIGMDALASGRVMDATLTLTEVVPLYKALEIMEPAPTPKIGDILYASWGYDQTNVDFYEVVGITKSGASVKVVEIGSKRVSGSEVVAVPGTGTGGKVLTKRVSKSSYGYSIAIESYSSAYLWDGKPKYETPAGYGH